MPHNQSYHWNESSDDTENIFYDIELQHVFQESGFNFDELNEYKN